MTKIFRCSFNRSKQPEPPEEEESSAAAAAWEYVDLEDGQGKHGGGMDSDASPTVGVVATIAIVIYCVLVGCVYLGVAYIYHDITLAGYVAFVGAMLLAMVAIFLSRLVPGGFSWWTTTVSD
ncbi:uncharacterized protein [Triticum aestivum]|uniref:uncharacterized protein n=1 Tax=Triticum aestivum TaxID=4565 RepID=UPI001D01AEA4|nr:uncharacterized protein LOC123066960 [Triticum aestivum]